MPLIVLFLAAVLVNSMPDRVVDEDVRKYVAEFEKDCNCTINFPVVIEHDPNFEESAVGVCYKFFNKRYVRVDKWYWIRSFDYERRDLIYHELGHCQLDREHDLRIMNTPWGDFPASVMYPETFEYPSELKEYYDKELFGELEITDEYPIVDNG